MKNGVCMNKKEYAKWRKVWLNNYIKQYKEADTKERHEIRRNIYKNINFTEKEKDSIFDTITRFALEE